MKWLFYKIRDWFRSPSSVPRPTARPGQERARKTGLLIGHSEADKGANNKPWYIRTTTYNGVYDEWVHDYDMDGDRLLEEYELNYSAAITSQLTYADRNEGRGRRGAAEDLAEADCTEVISMHCNSYNGSASGCEFWYLAGCAESKAFAERTRAAYVKEFPHLIDRGLKKAHKKTRAYGVLDALRDYGIFNICLAEWYFIDVKSDFIEPALIGAFLRKYGEK